MGSHIVGYLRFQVVPCKPHLRGAGMVEAEKELILQRDGAAAFQENTDRPPVSPQSNYGPFRVGAQASHLGYLARLPQDDQVTLPAHGQVQTFLVKKSGLR